MILNLSYNWLKEYLVKAPSPRELARILSLHSVSVERWRALVPNLENIILGEVIKIEPHPNADRLKVVLTKVDGSKVLKIVCGGSNLFVGQKVAVAMPGAKVRWHGAGELVELKLTQIRGVESEGMICASEEIGLGDLYPQKEEREILDLTGLKAKVGMPLVKALELDDTVMEVEATTNRPDLLSVLGVAREAAAILKQKVTVRRSSRAPRLRSGQAPREIPIIKEKINILVEDKKLCPRYQAVIVKGLKVGLSPVWLKNRLLAAGIRSINNVVDVTNYVMLELGQPLHAFDYEKVARSAISSPSTEFILSEVEGLGTGFARDPLQVKIVVRRARTGEKLKALDGVEYDLTNEMLVIADNEKALAIAGVMGGEESGINLTTTSIILESANFDPVSLRRTARALNLYSQSQSRFEKGLPAEGTESALWRALALLEELNEGKLEISAMTDVWPVKIKPKVFSLTLEDVERYIGISIPPARVKQILTSLGFLVSSKSSSLKVTPPYWRALDIESSRDLIEEIARLFGYHNLPAELPEGRLPVRPVEPNLEWEEKLKRDLASFGLTEVYTYSFISKEFLEKTGWPIDNKLVRLANPLSEEFEYMRPSMLPGSLAVAAQNQENFPEGRIFEISKVYQSSIDGDLPFEESRVMALVWSDKNDGEQFFKVKGFLENLFKRYRIDYDLISNDGQNRHPGRNVDILIKGEKCGELYEAHPLICEAFKIEKRIAFLDFSLGKFIAAAQRYPSVEPLPLFPGVKRDLSVIVDRKTAYKDLVLVIKQVDPLITKVDLFDVYKGSGVSEDKKSLALHILYQSSERTLTDAEVETVHANIINTLQQKFGAMVR